ncbi:putative prefoldin subunit 5 [Monoraphidium neglectum]|uniref:Putative prefoldin subunit 5 n=1 Tax=Monoraphidium neglectum TaxID=145388 RepID=A0A0D2M911_9CHLO|nr:putative prefoldin subunit 5 [Monoraphidium neglectum]KIY99754.1 putative prefoldin subunit 5 [Monoraphidium neglectum]|eukprot:XP_013898774.1 putative prefoldin subunit 5 [Monoraphidium neglectum]
MRASATQLSSVRESVESNCNDLADKSMQLQRLMAHFSSSNRAVQGLADSKPGQPLMVPLTESLYVPAKLADTRSVLVDVGTGYFVQMTTDAASDFCRRKSTKLEDTLKTVNQTLGEKRRALSQIDEVLAQKMAAGRQQQQQQQQQQPQQQTRGKSG